MAKALYTSDRVAAIANLIHNAYLLTDTRQYWVNTYVWSDEDLREALSYVPARFKVRGDQSWNPELRAYIKHCRLEFAKYKIREHCNYILYNGKEVRNFSIEDCLKYRFRRYNR